MKWVEKYRKAKKLEKRDIDSSIERIMEASKKAKPGTMQWENLRKEMEQELRNKKLVKEMRFLGFSPDRILGVVTVLVIAGFGFALDLNSPRALKIASFVLKLPSFKA